MHYQKTFLKQTVLRLDYPEIPALQSERKPQFSASLAERFPQVSGTQSAQMTFNIGPGSAGFEQQNRGWVWSHRSEAPGGRLVTLAPEFLALEYSADEFDDFPEFRDNFEYVFDLFSRHYKIPEFSRLGLRYINDITLDEGDPLDWDNIISPSLVASITAGKLDRLDLTRSMHQLIGATDDNTVLFNYGLLNPEFPNPVARRSFILDIDCFQSGSIDPGSVLHSIDNMNDLCEELFESSIEDGLRKIMGVINGD